MNQIISDNYHLIDMNKYISDTIKICLHKYNHYYDNIQTDIDINENIIKNNDLIILLNNKSFHFINEIIITFKNDFDNKLYFNYLPHELNLEIYSFLIDENSIKFNLFNLDCLFVEKINYYVFKDEVKINIKFKLIEPYLKNIDKHMNVKEFQNQIPNYLLNEFKYGIIINSHINRYIKVKIKNTIYNNIDFINYENKFLNIISC